MSLLGVFIGGEGNNELGILSSESPKTHPGVIEALLRAARSDGWHIVGGWRWKQIRKLRAHGSTPAEEQNVLGLVYEARRVGATAVAFLRDADNDRQRVDAIERGVATAREVFPDIEVVGGCPFPVLEAWILAVLGQTRTEQLRKATAIEQAKAKGIGKRTQEMVDAISRLDPKRLPADATGLRRWLAEAEAILTQDA